MKLYNDKIEDKNIIVSINGHPLYQSDWDLALQALAMNKRNEIAEEESLIVLERLIDEQLLLQRGLEIDLPQTEGMVRKSIVNAMIDKIVIEGEISEATDNDLKSFYEDTKLNEFHTISHFFHLNPNSYLVIIIIIL